MLIASISAARWAAYYLKLQHALYYLAGKIGIGLWYGIGSALLGYTGAVSPEQLVSAFSGLSPDGSKRYVQLPVGKNRQPATDVTLSVPKSVSVFWSVLGPNDRHKIEDLVLRAAKRVVDYLDSEAIFTRRGKDGKLAQHAKGLWALCPHGMSRSGDPQMHVHVLAINTCIREDGSTGTIRSKDLYLHKMAAGALFRLELAYLLQKNLGLSITKDNWKFEIADVPRSLCDEQSKRRKIIEEIAKEEGWESPRILAELAILTRDSKKELSLEDCLESWQATAARHGFTREVAEKLLADGETKVAGLFERCSGNLKELIEKSISSLATQASYFPERSIVQQLAIDVLGRGFNASDVIAATKNAVSQFDHRVQLPNSDYRYYSTRENIAIEKELIRRAQHGRLAANHLVSSDILARAKATAESSLAEKLGMPVTMTADQAASLIHITLEPGRTKLVQGYAGTGKTQMLAAANDAWTKSGYHVLGTAITGRAAQGLQQATGIESITVYGLLKTLRPELNNGELEQLGSSKSDTSSPAAYGEEFRTDIWLRSRLERSRFEMAQVIPGFSNVKSNRPHCVLTAKSILVVDEAAMLSTRTLLALMQECDRVGAKLVLIGDQLQISSIEAGGPFASLAKRLGCQTLTTVVRQKQAWMRAAVSRLIENEPREALAIYAANNALHLEKHQRAAIEKLIADYSQITPENYAKTLAVVSTNSEGSLINKGVQQSRKMAKQLGLDFVTLPNGERIHTNDRIMLTRNDYRHSARNGLLGTVIEIQYTAGRLRRPLFKVQLDGQNRQGPNSQADTVILQPHHYPHIQLGYAATTHKVAGINIERAFLLLSESMLNKELAFTQLTRAIHYAAIYGAEAQYGDSLDQLAQQMSKPTAKDLAHDHEIVRQPVPQVLQGRKRLHEAIAVLAPSEQPQLSHISASLQDLHLTRTQQGAAQLLIADFGKLAPHELCHAIALTATDSEAWHINSGIQAKRKWKQELGIDSIVLPNGERAFKNDRILLMQPDGLQGPTERMGTIVKIHRSRGLIENYYFSLEIRLDAREESRAVSANTQTIIVDAKDPAILQLGYAANVERLKHIRVESSYVLLGEMKPTQETALAQLTRASQCTTIYATQLQYANSLRPLSEQFCTRTAKDLTRDLIQQRMKVAYDQALTL